MDKTRQATIVVVDSSHRRIRDLGVHSHAPLLVFAKENFVGEDVDDPRYAHESFMDPSGREWGYWRLKREDLQILVDGVPVRPSGLEILHQPGTKTDFFLIPDLELVAKAGRLHRSCLAKNPTARPIAARLKLVAGSLGVVREQVTRETWVFHPTRRDPQPSDRRQRIAQQARYSLNQDGKEVAIQSVPFGYRKRRRTLHLKGDKIVLSLSNLPGFHDASADVGLHFLVYYELAARSVPVGDRPVPHQLPGSQPETPLQPASQLVTAFRPGSSACPPCCMFVQE